MGVKGLKDLINQHERKRGYPDKWEWLKELKNDGDSVTARFLTKGIVDTDDAGQPIFDFDVHEVHKVKIDGIERYVLCLQDDCPLCHAENVSFLRIWIPMQLTDGTKKVWARGKREILQMIELAEEYGDLTQYLWEIKRKGDKGCADTSYQLTPKPLALEVTSHLPTPPAEGSYIVRLTAPQMIQAVAGTLTLRKDGPHENR